MTENFFMNETNPKKISIQLTEVIHKQLKEYCDKRGLKLKYFIEEALRESITGSIEQDKKIKQLLTG